MILPKTNLWTGYLTGKNRDIFDMNVIQEFAKPATIGENQIYDSLIITERHDIISTIMIEYTNSLLRHYHDRLLTGNPNGQTYLYHSCWFMDFNHIQQWINNEKLNVKTWECVAQKVNLTLENEALPKAINNIPAAYALAGLVEKILDDEVSGFSGTDAQKMDQLFDDNVHLNTEGIFFMSAVSYASMIKKSPQGIDIPQEITPQTGQDLLEIAWEIVSQYQTEFQEPTMQECREIIEDQICASYWAIHDQEENTAFCQTWISNKGFFYNPFNWPDPE